MTLASTSSLATATVGKSSSYYSGESISAKDPEKVAGMFEGMFYRMMLEQMRKSPWGEDPLFDSPQLKQVRSMQDDELAHHLGNMGHLGIKDLLLEDLAKKSPQGGLLKDMNGSLS